MESEVKTRAERARIARAAGQVSSLTLVSRLLGLVREVPMGAAAAVMGLVVWGAAGVLERSLGAGDLAANLVTGLLPVLIGVAVYVLLTRGLRVAEAEALWSLVRQPFERNP